MGKHSLKYFVVTAMVTSVLLTSCADKKPPRAHIPKLKKQVFELQEAIKSQDRAKLDSLLSTRILDHEQNSDSLIQFCFDGFNNFAFSRLGDCEIVYTNDQALARCFIMDSTSSHDRPIDLSFVYEHDLWLLTFFEPGKIDSSDFGWSVDSTQ